MISVFQIYFDEKSYGFMDPAFYPFNNKIRDEFFENSVIKRIYEMNAAVKNNITYLGITSWKQQKNTHLTGSEIISYIQKDLHDRKEKDIYIYSPIQGINPKQHNGIWHGTIRQQTIWEDHKSMHEQISKDTQLLNKSGVLPFDLYDGKWQYCHKNYWIVTQEVFYDYCKSVLIPAINFFDTQSLPKWYTHSHEGRKTTSICFILEGLFGAFMAHRNYSFDYICKKKIKGKGLHKMITIDGYEITNN